MTYAAVARRPAPTTRQYSTPPRRDLTVPQTFRCRKGQPKLVHTKQTMPRKTNVWRTANRLPLCYHCDEANHAYRRYPYRKISLRGFPPCEPRRHLGK